jgi:hypothetical protein
MPRGDANPRRRPPASGDDRTLARSRSCRAIAARPGSNSAPAAPSAGPRILSLLRARWRRVTQRRVGSSSRKPDSYPAASGESDALIDCYFWPSVQLKRAVADCPMRVRLHTNSSCNAVLLGNALALQRTGLFVTVRRADARVSSEGRLKRHDEWHWVCSRAEPRRTAALCRSGMARVRRNAKGASQ